MQREAPNNHLPATHFIPMWIGYGELSVNYYRPQKIGFHRFNLHDALCIFKIRENKLPTLHNFKQTK